MFKLLWDSACEYSGVARLGERLWKERQGVKRYPTFLFVAIAAAVIGTWYATWRWYSPVPYRGPTGATLFFPGDGTQPTAVAKVNLYRLSHFEASMQATLPKDEKSVLTADVRFWQVNLIFDKEVDAENSILSVKGLTNESHIEIKDFDRRSAFVAITPATTAVSGLPFQPKGMLEIVVQPRTTERR